jgi:hypothetical protein
MASPLCPGKIPWCEGEGTALLLNAHQSDQIEEGGVIDKTPAEMIYTTKWFCQIDLVGWFDNHPVLPVF